MKCSMVGPLTVSTLRLYIGAWNPRGRLEASLSDNSAPVYSDTGINNTTGNDGGTVGSVFARQRYYPFGEIRPGSAGTTPTTIGYTGQRRSARLTRTRTASSRARPS